MQRFRAHKTDAFLLILTSPVCLQTKTLNALAAPPRPTARLNAWGSTVVPTVAAKSEASEDNNADAASQASGDASSVISRTEEARAGSVTADDERVSEASGARGSSSHQETPRTHSGVQVSATILSTFPVQK